MIDAIDDRPGGYCDRLVPDDYPGWLKVHLCHLPYSAGSCTMGR